ncbi:cytochrome (ubi)quinol oxidase subunit III [Melghirimyces algeriensis]|uniref:Cytochrome c oxidase subunit 3 n=1 Tax=Melghirimyces algeriensis TaxID=910412 RepID=A0A521DVM8_9BACL|nr:cytochrome (ubi)quinol oxidase subunit III [Melghirimyces algeriensis]SMO75799.1 cytochrome c oxidase subunit 3 [Melghirimyces algeriensis]
MRIEEQTASVAGLPAEPEKATLEGKNKILGFWFFLAAETTLFATMIGTYLALKGETMNGPTPYELFKMPMVAFATLILLTSSLTSVLGIMGMHANQLKKLLQWFGITILLGAVFLGLEVYEFMEYAHEGHTFTSSAFGSSFYLLLGTHGGHVLFGVLWILGLMIQGRKKGITVHTAPKFYVASLYWHFVDVVWIFIFTVVYLMGMIP